MTEGEFAPFIEGLIAAEEADRITLLKCPFCGSNDVKFDERDEGLGVLCRNCGVWATSGWFYIRNPEDAIELWNKRVK